MLIKLIYSFCVMGSRNTPTKTTIVRTYGGDLKQVLVSVFLYVQSISIGEWKELLLANIHNLKGSHI